VTGGQTVPDPPRTTPLEALALSLADGVAVDWTGAPHDCTGVTCLVCRLRAIEALITAAPPAGHDEAARDSVPVPGAWGPLHIIERIGRGSYGDVYRAVDTQLSRDVALKLLARRQGVLPERLVEEGRRLARVRHPNVVTVFGAETIDGRHGIWMELMPGSTLAGEVATSGPLPLFEAARITRDLAGALEAVHAAGLLHRDIKAQNVLRASDGRPVLTDFGAGRDLDPAGDGSPERTGTPVYVAPETVADGQTSVASDIYSLGVLLYFLLTGRYPVSGRSIGEIARAHRQGRGVPAERHRRDIPRSLAAILRRATDPEPSKRFRSAADLERALSAWLASHEWRRGVADAFRTGGASAIDALLLRPPAQRAIAVVAVALVIGVLWFVANYAAGAPARARDALQGSLRIESRQVFSWTRSFVQVGDVRGVRGVFAGLALIQGQQLRLACLYDDQERLFVEHRWPSVDERRAGLPGALACPPHPGPPGPTVWSDPLVRFVSRSPGPDAGDDLSLLLIVEQPADLGTRLRLARALGWARNVFVAIVGVAVTSWTVRRFKRGRRLSRSS
jgi:serine/threonine-protein kinase